jgi:hypothetical protein
MARRFVVAAEQALFRRTRHLEGHVVVDAIVSGAGRDNRAEDQRGGKRRGVRVFMSFQKPTRTGRARLGKAAPRHVRS